MDSHVLQGIKRELTDGVEPPDRLVHYTGPTGAIAICSSQTLLAGVPANMNDRLEQQKARDYCAGQLTNPDHSGYARLRHEWSQLREERAHSPTNDFVTVSFSAEFDSLAQWRAYGSAPGSMALVFAPAQVRAVAAASGFELIRCIYEPARQIRMARSIVATFARAVLDEDSEAKVRGWTEQFDDAVRFLGAVMKDRSFEAEHEWRLIAQWPPPQRLHSERIVLRPGQYGIHQYIEMELAPAFEVDPTARLLVGPDIDQAQALNTAHLLGMKLLGAKYDPGAPNVEVWLSGVPLRTH